MTRKPTNEVAPAKAGADSILGSLCHRTPEEAAAYQAEQERKRQALDRARLYALEGWLAAYQEGAVAFDTMCRGVVAVANALPDEMGTVGLVGGADKLVGYAVRMAIAHPPAKEGRSNAWPPLFREGAARLVDLINEKEGLPLKPSRHEPGKMSAFARVAQIMQESGVRGITERKIEEWRTEYRKSANLRDDG